MFWSYTDYDSTYAESKKHRKMVCGTVCTDSRNGSFSKTETCRQPQLLTQHPSNRKATQSLQTAVDTADCASLMWNGINRSSVSEHTHAGSLTFWLFGGAGFHSHSLPVTESRRALYMVLKVDMMSSPPHQGERGGDGGPLQYPPWSLTLGSAPGLRPEQPRHPRCDAGRPRLLWHSLNVLKSSLHV